ncbi:cyclic nucleotide-binding protein [Vibrio sp. UCD-FRSSP16_10]|uniref:DUF294 nucleotidyltransferase-like domain-containing protein n=1 Tax=unclassified Vibrio TaxID=2614977 RepID=UPI0007FD2CA9|nr:MULTISPECIES: DUF294 nucleotidyltransferase-like domain-containing protein [unclassified Vibrio]OBT16442.1 cyclic nucleotide-binding protein [Vibrio sp. UCD-FRSSP16_30]OBT21307.1 cyclic nucleotide-binding protein [Vibrio sp. UCD-FRSSP16_10]
MPEKFNTQHPPFDRLTTREIEQLKASLDIAYFRSGDTLLESGQTSTHLFVLIKGAVEEKHQQEVFAHYGHDDLFDIRSLFEGKVRHQYIALEDVLCYLLPSEVFLELFNKNQSFADYFDSRLSKRQQLIKEAKKQQNLAEFILTKVDESIYHPPLILTPDTSIKEATVLLNKDDIDAALVKLSADDPRRQNSPLVSPYAIVTRTNLLHSLVLQEMSMHTPVTDISTFPVFEVHEGDFVFNAMLTMTRNKMKRVMVVNDKQAVGMLDLTQILSAFSSHSHVLSLSIARAKNIEELAQASQRQHDFVKSLLINGIRTRFIMELISVLNEQIIEKAFNIIIPQHMQQHCCLLVLGSEGRAEQVLKTDQDNALIIEDGIEWPECQSNMDQFSETLLQLGYPLCPGKVMVNNPLWVASQSQWQKKVTQWIEVSNADSVMQLAIFSDALPVAGNKQLLEPIFDSLHSTLAGRMLTLSDFVRPALQFSVPLTLFGNVKSKKEGLDIKQGGIFSIVHGIRALALEHDIRQRNTFDRIEALHKLGCLEDDTADNLTESLKLFFKLRLAQQLAHQNDSNGLYSNRLDLNTLDRTERDLLRHSLHVVKKFKQFLSFHYQIRD